MAFPKFVQKVLIQGNFKSTKVAEWSLCKLEGGYMGFGSLKMVDKIKKPRKNL